MVGLQALIPLLPISLAIERSEREDHTGEVPLGRGPVLVGRR